MTELVTQDIERRSENRLLLELVNQIIVNQNNMDTKLSNHMVEESEEIAKKIAEAIAKLAREAFTDSNLDAHKKDHELRFLGLEEQFALGEARMGTIEASIVKNTEETAASAKVSQEIYEIVAMGKGFFKSLAWIGKWIRRILMWVLPLATAIMAFWYTMKNGE